MIETADKGKVLFIILTLRKDKVRVVSSRIASKKEKEVLENYEKNLKPIPEFKNEAEEREFWQSHDSTEYVDWSKTAIGVFPNLKRSTRLISLRLPENVIDKAKVEANKRDVPYQSLLKQIIYKALRSL